MVDTHSQPIDRRPSNHPASKAMSMGFMSDPLARMMGDASAPRPGSDPDLRLIDRICTEFENDWDNCRGPEAIRTILKRLPAALWTKVGLELSRVDIERSWIEYAAQWVSPGSSSEAEWIDPMDVDSFESYLDVLGFRGELSHDSTRELQLTEYQSRVRYGDCPPISRFPLLTRMDIDQRRMPRISLSTDASRIFEAVFDGRLTIGRQDQRDPRPIVLARHDNFNKLVITEISDATISRNQIHVTFKSTDVVCVQNGSSNRPVGVIVCGLTQRTFIIAPRSRRFVRVPIIMILEPYLVKIDRDIAALDDSC